MTENSTLTTEQIENWRRVLLTMVGPYALIMPAEEIQGFRNKMQGLVTVKPEELVTVKPEEGAGVAPKCSSCGHIGWDVTFDGDPYDEDVNNDSTPVWLCKDCRDMATQEV